MKVSRQTLHKRTSCCVWYIVTLGRSTGCLLDQRAVCTPKDYRRAKSRIAHILQNSAVLPSNLSRQLRNHAFNIVHQCIFTNHRARAFGVATGCSFCGHHEETCEHLFVHCPVALAALARMRATFSGVQSQAASFLSTASWCDHKLESKCLDLGSLRSLLCFSLAVWKTRRFFTGSHKPSLQAGAKRIVLEFSRLFRGWRTGGRRDKEEEKRSFNACLQLVPVIKKF